jgi:diadenosine tetraphosphate (Ap4A) HIT family hydrolase
MTSATNACPLCLPRPDSCEHWQKIRALSVSTLYLDRNQTYRGHCQLVYDVEHVVGLESLSELALTRFMQDVHRAAGAIARACNPDRMNYVSMGNVVPHLHWHLVPRYQGDPRWGKPIYTTEPADMRVTRLPDDDYASLVAEITGQL